jgi:beta propeller repeat protein
MMVRWMRCMSLWCTLLWCFFLLISGVSYGAQQYKGLCARVKIEILQELTLERIGFLATLEITNNEGDASITDFSAALTFENPVLSEEGNPNDASDLFFVQPPELEGIDSIDGTGVIPPTKTAVIKWFIIPKIAAGGIQASGVLYLVGCRLAGSIYGQEIAPEVLQVIPDSIRVRPEPQLDITYFQPRDVEGDDPFTMDVVESPVPFIVGCLVRNVGYGTALNVKIDSQQPRIVENREGLLLIAQLLGSRVDDEPTDETSLTVNLGKLEPARCRKCAWDMITSLSGEFIEFKASFTHASELGGIDTSVIKEMNAYFIAHEVINDQPGRDQLLDFLADTDNDTAMLPDTLFESDCNTLPVNHLTNVTAEGFGLTSTVTAEADREAWVYMRMDDPAQAKYPIESVVRSDGKVLNPHNCWTNIRYERGTNKKLTFLNIFDFVALGSYQYTVTYGQIEPDNDPPETRIRFSGEMQEFGGKYYILPETQIYFTVEDASPVGTYYRLDDDVDFFPAYPFTISEGGEHTVEYYSRDSADNEETHKIAVVVVSADYPGIQSFTLAQEEIFHTGDSLSVVPSAVDLSFEGIMTSSRLDAEIDIFRGVLGWVQLGGIPSSPTSSTEATIAVGGENVDYYRYRLGGGSWSDEVPVGDSIELSGLSEGTVNLYVKGRSRYGGYLVDDQAVHVSWVVASDAPQTTIINAPSTPARETDAMLWVSGVDLYRYTIDSGYYRPETEVSEPIVITGLAEGTHVISVIGKLDGGEWQLEENATTVSWIVDRNYGFDFSNLPQVYHIDIEDVGGDFITYKWDGRDESGAVLSPGWYTVRLTVRDELGRSTSLAKLVSIGDLMADSDMLWDGTSASQKNVHAFGRWAVWQDQRSGNWDIYTLDIGNGSGVAEIIAQGQLNQERPKTDGRYIVWEDRQPDGNWDIWGKELGSAEAPFAITETADLDEQKPAIYWPWVVYQSRPIEDPEAPWQLMAYNMETGSAEDLDPTIQDQLDPEIYRGKVVWQDFRNPGYGEIYLKDLKTGEVRRVTDDPYSQYHPVICENWIVWSDTRDTQSELYGYNLLRDAEVRLTDTPENETRPYLNGKWLVYEEDSAGVLKNNLRVLHLSNFAAMNLTNFDSEKERPALASGKVIWQDKRSGRSKVMIGSLPNLQAIFDNYNTVAVTEGMVSYLGDAHTLLRLWNSQAGVTSIIRYRSLVPTPVIEAVIWENGQPLGPNFDLEAGTFLWVRFDHSKTLHLGQGGECNSIDLALGENVFSYWCFPDRYSAYALIRDLGKDNIRAIRILDSETGRWVVAAVVDDRIVGEDFEISRVSVVMLDMKMPVSSWRPME